DDIAPGLLATGKDSGVADPASTPGTKITSMNVKLKAKARLFVTGRVRASTFCGPSFCTQQIGLYVDGSPLPGSGFTVGAASNSNATREVTVFGVSDTLSKGMHEIEMERTNTGH